MTPIRLLIVEDDELFRLGLVVRLQQEPELEIVCEAEDGETAIALAGAYPLDLVLLDVGLPRLGGLEACQHIKAQQPGLPILALTSRSEPSLISRLIDAGIQGFCLKGVDSSTLMLAIRSVAAGASWWDCHATREIRSTFAQTLEPLPPPRDSLLTPREREILRLLASGQSDREIARHLYISPGTVRVHLHAIIKKLGAANRQEAILVWQTQETALS
ncbi:MAG: response regulator [Cyanobacteria bacterium RI_101]|nr:response regulator [Cyanobacteria bacterium RI_101]